MLFPGRCDLAMVASKRNSGESLSIRHRLLLLVLAVWLPAVIGFAMMARAVYERGDEAARIELEQVTRMLTYALERELDSRAVMARTLASSYAVRTGQISQFYEDATHATAAGLDWAVLVNATEHLANTKVPLEKGRRPRAAGSPSLVTEPQAYFLRRGAVTESPLVIVFAPSVEEGATPLNVGVAFDQSVLQGVLGRHALPEGANAAIIDRDHKVVARSRDPQKWVGSTVSDALRNRISSQTHGFADLTTLDGVPSLSYLVTAAPYDWSLVVSLPKASLANAAWRVTAQAAAAGACLLLISLLVARIASRRISRPMMTLFDAARELTHERTPADVATGVLEADRVSHALHEAGERAAAAKAALHERVADAVHAAQVAQANLFQGQKNEAIGRLTGGLAHDLNNLLQTISMALQMTLKKVDSGRPQRTLQTALQACGKAADLIAQMLSFGRVRPLQLQAVDLRNLLLGMRELAGKAAGEGVELIVDVAPDVPDLLVEPTQLELALLNLIFNARDAMPSGGKVRVHGRRAGPLDMPGSPSGSVCVEVMDEGMGMDAATLERVLDPYFTTKPVGAGSGLGLTQVNAFATQSGGSVKIHSVVGVGTRVILVLPSAESHADTGHLAPPDMVVVNTPASPTVPTVAPRSLKVLMVEDDVLVSSLVIPALEEAGHEVLACTTADDALTLLATRADFDVVFTDIVMPGTLNGLQLAAWCRANRAAMAVLVATGYSRELPDPSLRVLRKPYTVDDVLDAMHELTRERAP